MQCFFSNLLCTGKTYKGFRTKILFKLAHLLEFLAPERDVLYQYCSLDFFICILIELTVQQSSGLTCLELFKIIYRSRQFNSKETSPYKHSVILNTGFRMMEVRTEEWRSIKFRDKSHLFKYLHMPCPPPRIKGKMLSTPSFHKYKVTNYY